LTEPSYRKEETALEQAEEVFSKDRKPDQGLNAKDLHIPWKEINFH
jgi:hypothetical protein